MVRHGDSTRATQLCLSPSYHTHHDGDSWRLIQMCDSSSSNHFTLLQYLLHIGVGGRAPMHDLTALLHLYSDAATGEPRKLSKKCFPFPSSFPSVFLFLLFPSLFSGLFSVSCLTSVLRLLISAYLTPYPILSFVHFTRLFSLSNILLVAHLSVPDLYTSFLSLTHSASSFGSQ